MVTRLLSLAVEICLASASAIAFGGMLVHGSRAGRVAFRAMVFGAWAALIAALGTIAMRVDDVWLMDAWRVDVATQAIKALVLIGLLVSVRLTRQSSDEWSAVRAVGPFFRLACAGALAVAASAADLVVLWIALDLATVALVLAVAVGGRWEERESTVRRMVYTWLPSSLVLLLGVVLLMAVTGATRYSELETTLLALRTKPVVMLGVVLVVGGIMGRALRLVVLMLPAPTARPQIPHPGPLTPGP